MGGTGGFHSINQAGLHNPLAWLQGIDVKTPVDIAAHKTNIAISHSAFIQSGLVDCLAL